MTLKRVKNTISKYIYRVTHLDDPKQLIKEKLIVFY